MTDTEFKALRPGDKVSVSGKQIAFNAAKCRSRSSRFITGQTIWTMCTKPIALGIVPRSKTGRRYRANGSARVAEGGVEPGGFTRRQLVIA